MVENIFLVAKRNEKKPSELNRLIWLSRTIFFVIRHVSVKLWRPSASSQWNSALIPFCLRTASRSERSGTYFHSRSSASKPVTLKTLEASPAIDRSVVVLMKEPVQTDPKMNEKKQTKITMRTNSNISAISLRSGVANAGDGGGGGQTQ